MTFHMATLCSLTTVAALLGACAASDDPSTGRPAPLQCLSRAKQDPRIDMSNDYLVQLCSGATDPEAPLRCYRQAMNDPLFQLNRHSALMLCSPFNLDAYKVLQQDCPSVDTSGIEQRLSTIERQLDELADHR